MLRDAHQPARLPADDHVQTPLGGGLHHDVAADGLTDAELVPLARCLIRAPGGAVEEPVLFAVLRDLDPPRSSGLPPETGERVVPGAARRERESDGQEQDRRGETRDGSPSAAAAAYVDAPAEPAAAGAPASTWNTTISGRQKARRGSMLVPTPRVT